MRLAVMMTVTLRTSSRSLPWQIGPAEESLWL